MAVVQVHATGEEIEATGALLDYYLGEAGTVGGYTIDGSEYPRKIAASDFDPAEHTVEEVQAHLALSMPGERARVIAAEQAGQARVTLLRDYEIEPADEPVDLSAEQVHPGFGVPMVGVEAPADGTEVEISTED